MSLKPIEDALRQTPLFAHLVAEDIQRLAMMTVKKKVARREILFRQGDKTDGFFVVESGRVKVFKLSPGGKEQILHLIEPPHSFAEATLFEGGDYPSSAEAMVDSEIFFFPKRHFISLLEREPKLSLRMMASLSKWLKRMTDLVEVLSLKDVEARLLWYIAEELRESGKQIKVGAAFELSVTKSVLAARLGTVPETLSRTLKQLQDDGVLAVTGKKFKILKPGPFLIRG